MTPEPDLMWLDLPGIMVFDAAAFAPRWGREQTVLTSPQRGEVAGVRSAPDGGPRRMPCSWHRGWSARAGLSRPIRPF